MLLDDKFVETRAKGEVYRGKVNPKPRKKLDAKVCKVGK